MGRALRRFLQGLGALAVWMGWLVLALVLAIQIYVATHHEMALPGFAQRALESRLAASGLQARFGRTRFDPSGRVLVEDVRLSLPGIEEPVITATAIAGRINPVALLAGRFEPLEVRFTGLSARVPAALSPSGASDEIVHNVDGVLLPRGAEVAVPEVTGWFGAMPVTMRGTLRTAAGGGSRTNGPLPIADFLAHHYGEWSARAAGLLGALSRFDQPLLRLRLIPGGEGVSACEFTADASGVRVGDAVGGIDQQIPRRRIAEAFIGGAPVAAPDARSQVPSVGARVTALRVDGVWRMDAGDGAAIRVRVSFRRASGLAGITVDDGVLVLEGNAAAGKPSALPLGPTRARLAAREVNGRGWRLNSAWVDADLTRYPSVHAHIAASLGAEPQFADIRGDALRRAGEVDFRLQLDSAFLTALRDAAGIDVTRFIALGSPVAAQGRAILADGGTVQSAVARIDASGVNARRVLVDEARGEIDFDGSHLRSPDAFLRVGENEATGVFEDNLRTNDYRFLLDGRLRPLDITPWIAGDWWASFFSNFAFEGPPLAANIDLRGCWTDGRAAVLFLGLNALQTSYQGWKADALAARMFIRPQFTDVLELHAAQGAGSADGTFSRTYDFQAGDWRTIDVALASTLDPVPAGKLLGPDGADAIAPFGFEQLPRIDLLAHFTNRTAPEGEHRRLRVAVDSVGPVSYLAFPLDRASFTAEVRDDHLEVSDISADVAGGTVDGSALLVGAGSDRRLSFSAAAHDLSLGLAAEIADAFSHGGKAAATAATGRFIREKANVRADGRLAGGGVFGSLAGFRGSGSLELRGGEIGEIRMLGMLTALLRFTALRFTAAKADFTVDGPELDFTDISLTGANSIITGRGTYGLERHQLDFRARLNPFGESHAIPERFMDLVLTPLSNALEVRLTGSLEKPSWAFVNGPTNLLRNLAPPNGVAPNR